MMTFRKPILFSMPTWSYVLLFLFLLSPHRLLACATCFGSVDSDMARGMSVGILVLLVVVAVVLGGILSAGLVMVARARRLGEEEDDDAQRESVDGITPERLR